MCLFHMNFATSGARTAYPSEHLGSPSGFSEVHVTPSLFLCVCFVDLCLYFFFWPLCCLFFYDLRIFITPSVYDGSPITPLKRN
jgi:hypothetical protein